MNYNKLLMFPNKVSHFTFERINASPSLNLESAGNDLSFLSSSETVFSDFSVLLEGPNVQSNSDGVFQKQISSSRKQTKDDIIDESNSLADHMNNNISCDGALLGRISSSEKDDLGGTENGNEGRKSDRALMHKIVQLKESWQGNRPGKTIVFRKAFGSRTMGCTRSYDLVDFECQ